MTAEPGYLESATIAVARQLAVFYRTLRNEGLPKDEARELTIAWLTNTALLQQAQIQYNSEEKHQSGAVEGEENE